MPRSRGESLKGRWAPTFLVWFRNVFAFDESRESAVRLVASKARMRSATRLPKGLANDADLTWPKVFLAIVPDCVSCAGGRGYLPNSSLSEITSHSLCVPPNHGGKEHITASQVHLGTIADPFCCRSMIDAKEFIGEAAAILLAQFQFTKRLAEQSPQVFHKQDRRCG
jgi:hypothetical protein